MDPQGKLHSLANDAIGEHHIGERRDRLAKFPNQSCSGDQVVAQPVSHRDFPLGNQMCARPRVHLSNFDPGWADHIAYPAAAAVIHRTVR